MDNEVFVEEEECPVEFLADFEERKKELRRRLRMFQ